MLRSIVLSRRAVVAGAASALPLLARPARAQEATTASPTAESGVLIEPLIEDARVQLDSNGRAQIARITMAPNAELPEDFLAGPLIAIVESGSFQVQAGDDPFVTLETGDRIEPTAGEVVRARNNARSEGTWLVLLMAPKDDWGRPLELEPPPGLQVAVLVHRKNLREHGDAKRIFVDRITLTPGAEHEVVSPDPAESLDFIGVHGLVGETQVVNSTDPSANKTIPAGATDFVPTGPVSFRNAGSDPTTLLLIRQLPDSASPEDES